MLDEAELAKAGIHLSVIGDVFEGLLGLIGRVNLIAAAKLVYEAYPEIEGDVEELIKDVVALIAKIRALP